MTPTIFEALRDVIDRAQQDVDDYRFPACDYGDAEEAQEAEDQAHAALMEANRHVDALHNVRRYNEALNELGLAPNGDDYNTLLDLLTGRGYRPPHVEGR